MRRTLLLTNDFKPRPGGIQAYLHALATGVPAADLVVYAPSWPGAAEFDAQQPFEVVRHPTSLMLPVPDVLRRARAIARAHGSEAVWFGAAAPLALLAPALRRGTGIERALASTHGHEVGWAMLPGARQALRRIGNTVDVITFVSRYTRSRFAGAFGPMAALEHLPPGVDTDLFTPDPAARSGIRARYRLGERPVVLCVSRLMPRKGQDTLIRALPQIRRSAPGAVLLLVGGGPYRGRLQRLAAEVGVAEHVVFAGGVAWEELPAHYAAGDVFVMPCRTHAGGLDVEGLGIVFLEAAAVGLPVVAGNSGGAPETVRDGETGTVVDGRRVAEVAAATAELLADHVLAAKYGSAGRAWVLHHWQWTRHAERLTTLLSGS